MEQMSGSTVKRLMRANRKTISGIAASMNIPMTRVRFVRTHGVTGAGFARDWLEALCAKSAA